MSALLEFSIIPLDKEPVISHFISRVTSIIRESGLPHTFGPMSGCVEGEWDELMALATRCFKDLEKDCNHILVNMRVLWRAGQTGRISNHKR